MKFIVNMLLHPKIPEFIMSVWMVIGLSIFKRSKQLSIAVLKSGITLHKLLVIPWTLWFKFYLARDANWAVTLDAIHRNPWCPDSVAEFYKDMLFDMSADKLKDTFNILPWSQRLTELYRERQARCGFTALI